MLPDINIVLRELATTPEATALQDQLYVAINHFITHDFERLVQLLYRIDISEDKLRRALQQQPKQDAALLISKLIVERLQEKKESRNRFTPPPADDPGAERW